MILAILVWLKIIQLLQNWLQPHSKVTPLLPPANVVCEGYVFTGVCLSTGGVLSQHALQVVSQHALQQVSGGGCYPSMPCSRSPEGGVSRPTLKGEVEGGDTPPPDGYFCGRYAFLFLMRTGFLGSSQSCRSVDADAWCKRALKPLKLLYQLHHRPRNLHFFYHQIDQSSLHHSNRHGPITLDTI